MEGFTFWDKVIIFGVGVFLFPIFLTISFALFLWYEWFEGVVLIFWIIAMPFFISFWLVWFPKDIPFIIGFTIGPILGIVIFFLHFKVKKALEEFPKGLAELLEKIAREEKRKMDMRL